MEKAVRGVYFDDGDQHVARDSKGGDAAEETENQPERAWKFGHDGEKRESRGPTNTAEVARGSPVRSFVFMDVASTRGGGNGKAKCERLEIKEVCANSKRLLVLMKHQRLQAAPASARTRAG